MVNAERISKRTESVIALTMTSWFMVGASTSAAITKPDVTGRLEGDPMAQSVGHQEEPVSPPVYSRKLLLAEQRRTPGAVVTRGGFTSVQVNTDGFGNNIVGDAANEPSIAVDPTNPDRLVIGWRQFDTITSNFRQAGVGYSHDGGATWTSVGPLDPGVFRSDPVLGADNNGTFFFLSLSSGVSMEMFRSLDGGVSWSDPIPAFGGDKEWMTIDTTGGFGDGNIYTIWQPQVSCCDGHFSISRDAGLTYTGPIRTPEPQVKFGTLDIGPDGELYLGGSTLDESTHAFARSTNPYAPREMSFDFARNVDLGGPYRLGGAVNPIGLLGVLWIAADRSNGLTRGFIYMLSSVKPASSDPLDVHLVRSVDGGETWSAPIRVNDDSSSSGAWQWFGTMSVAPNGRIDVVWNDTRNAADPATSVISELFYSYSLDAGFTWSPNIALAPPFDSTVGHPSQAKIGDYYHMISDVGGVNLAYAATFNGEQDVYFLRIPADCNDNGVPDDQDVLVGGMPDCNGNLVPDTCEAADDCNGNSIQDICELVVATDCNRNLILDECEDTTDCNTNAIQDICEVFDGSAPDCNTNGVPDACDISSGYSLDNNESGVPDECENACCACDGCIETTESDCLSRRGTYLGDGSSCATSECPRLNDTCDQREILPNDLSATLEFDNRCATPTESVWEYCENLMKPFTTDLWYEYTTPCCGELTVSLCQESNFNAMLLVYGGEPTCACPFSTNPSLACSDNACGADGLQPTITLPVDQDECYLFRIGGWYGETGTGVFDLTMTCQPDTDHDGVCTALDNCGDDFNPGQEDADDDGIGDVCDPCPLDPENDRDGDGVCGNVDNCRTVPNSDQTDADGNGIGDVCEPTVVYVDAHATGANTGLDWANAFTDLQDGLELAPTLPSAVPVEIWVADGTYIPSVPTYADPRSVTFSIPAGVRVLGGFAGGETNASQRDPSIHVALLTGDIAQDDGEFPGNNAENAYSVVLFETPGDPSEVSGFTITRGNADNAEGTPWTELVGGGVTFFGDQVGGAVRHCIVTENFAVAGGGVGISSGPYLPSIPEVSDCLIKNNWSGFGGGMIIGWTSPTSGMVFNTRFVDNSSFLWAYVGYGGGLLIYYAASSSVVGCEFIGNFADADGGAIYTGLGPFETSITNATISGNTAARAGGIYAGDIVLNSAGGVNVRNTIVFGNADDTGSGEGSQIAIAASGTLDLNYSCVQGLTGALGGVGNIGTDPRFVTPGEDLRPRPGAPVVDAGQNVSTPWPDLDGNPRFFDGDGDGTATIDMGAYESQVTVYCEPADPPSGEVSCIDKNRYISLVPGNVGARVGLRVTLTELGEFGSYVGATRWVGPPSAFPEEDLSDPHRTFVGAMLQCDPYFADWGSIALLHVFGGEVIPNSVYEVQAVHESCVERLDDPASFSAPLTVETGKFGDVTTLFEGEDPGAPQPDFNDISAVVSKFTGNPDAVIKAQAQLQPNVVFADRAVDFRDIADAVRAFVGEAYSDAYPGPCPCPSVVTCGATPCANDLACPDGFCISGFCTDACGRCTP